MRSRWLVLLAVVVGLGLLGSTFYGSPFVQPVADEGPPSPDGMIQPGDAEHYLWPYTSRHRSIDGRTLAINIVIHGEPDHVEQALVSTLDGNWTEVEGHEGISETDEEASSDDDALAPEWQTARGAARYTYIATAPNRTGEWITADYQLATGTYFGERTHVRAYTADAIGWTALQVHNEYWDWFRLRHTVTGVAPGARFVEQDLRDEPGVVSISRIYHGLRGGGSDGWLTVVELTTAALIVGFVIPFEARRVNRRDILLPLALTTIILGVRGAGVGMEALLPNANPKVIAGGLYLVLVVAPPITVAWFARTGPAQPRIIGTIIGLGAGFALDFGVVRVSMLPLDLVFHRIALIAALAILTIGVARGDRTTTVAGIIAWLLGLTTALTGVL